MPSAFIQHEDTGQSISRPIFTKSPSYISRVYPSRGVFRTIKRFVFIIVNSKIHLSLTLTVGISASRKQRPLVGLPSSPTATCSLRLDNDILPSAKSLSQSLQRSSPQVVSRHRHLNRSKAVSSQFTAPSFNCHIDLTLILWFPDSQNPESVLDLTLSSATSTSPSLVDNEAPSATSSTIHSRDQPGTSSLSPRLPQKRHENIRSPHRAAPNDDPDDVWMEKHSTGLKIIQEHYQIRHKPWQSGRYSSKYHGSSTSRCFLLGFYRAIGPGTFNKSVFDFNCATIKLLEEWFPDLEDGTEFAFHDIITRQEHLYSEEESVFSYHILMTKKSSNTISTLHENS
jgi:hypothetical protein